jgi:hypothetical protein
MIHMIHVNDGARNRLHSSAMSVSFHIAALSDDQVPQALPLIQATWPGADLAAWRSFVRFFNDRAAAKDAGVLTLRDAADCICGVLAYRLDRDLRAGRMLAVPLFTAVDLINSPRTVRALLDAAEMRAAELGCVGVQIRLYSDQSGLASRLRLLGLSCEGGLFWKKIDPAQIRN